MISDNNVKIVNELNKLNTFRKIKFIKGEIYICSYKTIISNLRKIISKNPRIWLKDDKAKQKSYFED